MNDLAPIPITDLAALRANGVTYPSTVDGWRWAFRQREARGLEHVFVRQGRRILVDVPAYIAALRSRAA
jgi:hypothetical protein